MQEGFVKSGKDGLFYLELDLGLFGLFYGVIGGICFVLSQFFAAIFFVVFAVIFGSLADNLRRYRKAVSL